MAEVLSLDDIVIDLDDEPASLAEKPSAPTSRSADAQRRLQAKKDELLEEHVTILRDAALARQISPAAKEPPQDWVDEHGEEEAWNMFRVAQAAWLNGKAAPVFLTLSTKVLSGLARDSSGKSQVTLNVGIMMPEPVPITAEAEEVYPVIDVEDAEV